jgi:ubiquinone/menaquinone biosynthesis C-methylase UbiE
VKILLRFADYRKAASFAAKLRKKRFELFKSYISTFPKPINVLDVGGTQLFWENMGFIDKSDIKITILNISKIDIEYPNFVSVVGDAREMKDFADNQFDVVFSNSVIEHVGTYKQQLQMADEIKRVGKTYFIQTPNKFFPIEPHFLFPLFQFLPLQIKILLIQNFNLGWCRKITDKQKAIETVNSINLLTKKNLKNLFPDALMFKEKLCGLTKSFIVTGKV